MKIVFFGTPEFAVASLDAIRRNGHEILAVVTAPDRIGGRGNKLIESDVKKYAVANDLPVLQPEKLRDPGFITTLESLHVDLFVVIAFRMLPEVVWRIPPFGTFNLHASLLPQLRGAAPINHAIMSGFKTTGVTTFFINSEIDKGEVLMSESTVISDEDDAGSLHDRLMEMGAKIVVKTIEGIGKGNLSPTPQPQADSFTPAPKIFKENCRIDFKQPVKVIDRFIRGLSPYPGAWSIVTLSDGRELEVKLLKCMPGFEKKDGSPGDCMIENKSLNILGTDGYIKVLTIQPSGKKPMDAKAFMAGYSPVKFL